MGGSQQVTGDTLWIPAYSEVVGPLGEGAEFYNSYDSEGDQYQLFSDAGVSWGGDTSFLAVGANWWLRSPDRASSIRYLSVLDDGTLGWRFRPQADHAVLVSSASSKNGAEVLVCLRPVLCLGYAVAR